nr:hypothetical protein [Tanacetum cinerariifolium]
MVKDSEWFKDKMLLAQAQKARVVLNEDQQDFLANRLEENNDCAIFMASLSPAGSLNDDIVAPTYDSDILYEIVEFFLWHSDSGCSKHMTGHRDKLINFVSTFIAKSPTQNDWDLLFQPMVDEYFKPPSVISTSISAATLPPPDITGASSSTTIDKDAPSLSTSPNNETTPSLILSITVEEPNKEEEVEFDSDTFTNPLAPPKTSSAESSSRIVDISNMRTLQQPHINTKR